MSIFFFNAKNLYFAHGDEYMHEAVDRLSYIIALITLIGTWLFFFIQTNEFLSSLTAGILTALLVWMSYVIMRWLILSFRE